VSASNPDRTTLKLWLPVLAWALLIFIGSQIPYLHSPLGSRFLRKVAHAVEYGIFAILLARAFRGSGLPRGWWAAALACAAVFAASDEWHQHFVRGRHPSVRDFEIDVLGSVIGLALFWIASHGSPLRPALPERPDGHR
jgi:VanZ family protein